MNEVMSKELATKLFNVFSQTGGLTKDITVGKGDNKYSAVGEKSVLNMLKPLFKEQKLIIIPKGGDISENLFTYIDGYGKNKLRAITQLKVYFTIVDTDTGEGLDIVGFGNGADSQDKGSGKAFTYAFKTCLQKTFMLFSGEDADNTHSDDIDKGPTELEKTANWKKTIDRLHKNTTDANLDFLNDVLLPSGTDTLKEAYETLPTQRKAKIALYERTLNASKENK